MPAPRLLLVIHGLGGGGAERVFSILASAWAQRGWHVELATYSDDEPFHALASAVQHVRLGLARPSPSPLHAAVHGLRRVAVLRRLVRARRPDVMVSFQEGVNIEVLLATLGLPTPVIVSPRCDPRSREYLSPLRQRVRPLTHRRAARIVMQTNWARDVMPHGVRHLCRVIPNPVVLPAPDGANSAAPPVMLPRPTILGLGRLVPEKGFDLLLSAFARLSGRFPTWWLSLLGDGPCLSALERQCADLGIGGRVRFFGQTRHVAAALRQGDLFVLPSRTEGFPNALLEAMACGLPAIAADCPMGPRDIVRHEIDGLLVPPNDCAALAAAMERLLTNATLRAGMAARAADALERFALPRILEQWDAVLAEAAPRVFSPWAPRRTAGGDTIRVA